MNDLLSRVDAELEIAKNLNPVMALGMLEVRKMIVKAQAEDIVSNNTVTTDICKELQKAMKTNPLFTSPHHGYAIILEELDELWDEVKKRQPDVKNMRAEAVQVAAMAVKFIMSMDVDWEVSTGIRKPKPQTTHIGGSKEDLLKFETKCQLCLYHAMTREMLDELGNDPCDTCGDDCRNWKPKEQPIDHSWKVCENCRYQPRGNDIPQKCEECEDDSYGTPSNFSRRSVRK